MAFLLLFSRFEYNQLYLLVLKTVRSFYQSLFTRLCPQFEEVFVSVWKRLAVQPVQLSAHETGVGDNSSLLERVDDKKRQQAQPAHPLLHRAPLLCRCALRYCAQVTPMDDQGASRVCSLTPLLYHSCRLSVVRMFMYSIPLPHSLTSVRIPWISTAIHTIVPLLVCWFLELVCWAVPIDIISILS